MSKYYYLVAGLPELTLEDNKLGYTVADFKTEFYPFISAADRKLMDLYYLQFDNANLLKLLKDKDTSIDARGLYPADELSEGISQMKGGSMPADCALPSYMAAFLAEYFKATAEGTCLLEDRMAALYYAFALKCKNKFIASWFEFNLAVNNILAALTARKYKMDIASRIVGNTVVSEALRTSGARDFGLGTEVDYWEQLQKIGEAEDLLEREKKIDQLRWNWLDEHSSFHYFTIECLFVFLQELGMIERWISLDKEKGNQMFRSMIAALKDEVQIPAEFR